jgi:lytic murein transglycosylase
MAAGVSAATFDRAFRGVRPNPDILAKDSVQPEFTRPVWSYLDTAVSERNIAAGRLRLAENSELLRRAARPHGVPAQIVVAIWGLESAYGVSTGDHNVIESLATLAYESRRPAVFRRNLIDALLILEAGDIQPADMRGSWAGAMGQTQFMPAAFRRYAVDGDGDGRRDIWRSLPDVFASTANYLAASGWRPGQPWGAEVRLPPNFPWDQAEIDILKPVSEWAALGVRRVDGEALPQVDSPAAVIAPAGHRGPAFVIFDNFRTILAYNNSVSYALAVAHLADRIAGGGAFAAAWPRSEPPLSLSDRLDLQNLLNARGYDPGELDGVVGPRTRGAIRRFQQEIGEVPDGNATMALLTRLRALMAS